VVHFKTVICSRQVEKMLIALQILQENKKLIIDKVIITLILRQKMINNSTDKLQTIMIIIDVANILIKLSSKIVMRNLYPPQQMVIKRCTILNKDHYHLAINH
jgi:hypothetical protein